MRLKLVMSPVLRSAGLRFLVAPAGPWALQTVYGAKSFCSDLRRKVVFFGIEDKSAPAGITCIGTGFLVSYDGGGYLVTNRHLSLPLEEIPFLVNLARSFLRRRDGA